MIRYGLSNLFKTLVISNESALVKSFKALSTSSVLNRDVVDRKVMLKSIPAVDEGTPGEKTLAVDSLTYSKANMFPTIDTPNKLFDGTPYKTLPIVSIRVTRNNTILSLLDHKGPTQMIRSCGMEGYKNTRKGTNVAAQSTSITLATKILERGIKTVRVKVRGLGPGRMAAIKGLQMAGLDIVSITDDTRVSWNPPRARKQRKL